jgi:hypothetical protein
MNYLVTSDRCFVDAPGGSYRVAWELAQYMARRGNRVSFLCGSLPGDPAEGARLEGDVQVVRFRFPSLSRFHPLRWSAQGSAIARATAELPALSWDLVHAHSLGGAAVVARRCGAPLVYSVHSPAVSEQRVNWAARGAEGLVKTTLGLPLLRRSERRVLERATCIHVLSVVGRGGRTAGQPRRGTRDAGVARRPSRILHAA